MHTCFYIYVFGTNPIGYIDFSYITFPVYDDYFVFGIRLMTTKAVLRNTTLK